MSKRTEHLRRALLAHGPKWLAVALAVGAAGAVCGALWQTVDVVTVTDADGAAAVLMTALDTPEELLPLADLALGPDDSAFYETTGAGEALLRVVRAFPLTVHADGAQHAVQVSAGTVAEAVAKAGVRLNADDFTEPELAREVAEDLGPITVHRVTYEDTVTTEPVPFETEYLEEGDPDSSKYTHDILRQAGVEGSQEVVTRAKFIDGEPAGSEVVETRVLEAPVTEIRARVYNNVVSPLEAPAGVTVTDNVPSQYSQVYTMKATGYYSPRGRGASGLGLYYGTFAVDPTLIPYGTKVYIVSTDGRFVYGWAIATDTGAFIHSNRMQVDLFYETYAESAANGVKQVYVYVP